MRSHPRHAFPRFAPACAAALATIALAACGSSSGGSTSGGSTSGGATGASGTGTGSASSSTAKPAYCSTINSLRSTVNDLTHLSTSGGVAGLAAQVAKLKSDATTLVNQAKSDFPAETSALQSSVTKLETAVKTLESNPSAGAIASVATAAASAVTTVTTFVDSSRSKCG